MSSSTPLETPLHLYQPVQYSGGDGTWTTDFFTAAAGMGPDAATWDVAAILSILSSNFPTGDRTLLRGVVRQPWLSKIRDDGGVDLSPLPEHGTRWEPTSRIAEHLEALLLDEVERVCQGRDEIYLLLSGGLDSRIVAGVLHRLGQQGRLQAAPVAVTWGLPHSRDVHYGRAVAELLGFEWRRMDLGPDVMATNLRDGFQTIGGLVSPTHLHAMLWFRDNVGRAALVLAASYGDSVGRAEFSGKHVLELRPQGLENPFGLVRDDLVPLGEEGLHDDRSLLDARAPQGSAPYVHREAEMQGWYMRGMIAQAMNVVNAWCTLYQVFTAPEVYAYMWSLHPARRDDEAYAELLERLHPGLARLPWARTNRALSGKTRGARRGLSKQYHDYVSWTRSSVYPAMSTLVDADWFESTGVFDPDGIRALDATVATGGNERWATARAVEIWLWLAGLRIMVERLQLPVSAPRGGDAVSRRATTTRTSRTGGLRRRLRTVGPLYKSVSIVRRTYLRRQALGRYPRQED